MFRQLLGTAAIVAACGSSALAAPNSYDGFNYPVGELTGANGGSGWGGAYTDTGNSTLVEAATLSYPQFATSAGSVRTNDGSGTTTINFRNVNQVYGDNETETWISFLGRRNGATSTTLFAGVSFYNTLGAAPANGEVSFASTTAGTLQWRVLDLGGAVSTNAPNSIAEDVTDLLVGRIVWNVPDAGLAGTGDDAVYLYVNPVLGGAPPSIASASAGRNVAIMDFDKIRIAGQNALDYSFDEIRIGATFADVTPTVAANTDFDGGGTGLSDFHVIRNNYLTGTVFAQGDANADGLVNHLDFFLWRTAFVGAGGSLEGLTLFVPEPATGAGAVMAAMAILRARRARRRLA